MDMAWHESNVAMRPCINMAFFQNGDVLRWQCREYRNDIAREPRARRKAKGPGWLRNSQGVDSVEVCVVSLDKTALYKRNYVLPGSCTCGGGCLFSSIVACLGQLMS